MHFTAFVALSREQTAVVSHPPLLTSQTSKRRAQHLKTERSLQFENHTFADDTKGATSIRITILAGTSNCIGLAIVPT